MTMNFGQMGIALTAAMGLAWSQTNSEKSPVFEVASIKPSVDGAAGGRRGIQPFPGGRISVTNMSPQSLITFAYEVKDNQISGAPKWLAEESYDIVGKAEGAVSSRDQLRLLLQSLLVDRFKLAFHDEAREVPVYALTVAKGGSKLQQTREGSCLVIDFNHPPAPPPPGQERPRPCGALARRRGNGGSETMDGVGIGITRPAGGTTGLTDALSEILGRPVVDKTGLTGIFDFHLEWTPDSAAAGDNPGPSILTALQQQLGLRVVPDKGPVRMLVIDHVERPVN